MIYASLPSRIGRDAVVIEHGNTGGRRELHRNFRKASSPPTLSCAPPESLSFGDLLAQIAFVAHFFDLMNLRLKEIHMLLFVPEQALE